MFLRTRKKLSVLILRLSLAASGIALLFPDNFASADTAIETALQWAVGTANDETHGYSQKDRWGPDYDCSSFVITALKKAGINTGGATTTSTMKSNLLANGFTWIPWSASTRASLKRGDILLNEGEHANMYLGNDQVVGAHSDRGYPATGDQTKTEISVSAYYDSNYDGVLRYVGTSGGSCQTSAGCNCSDSYAGNYVVTTKSDPLILRSGHAATYSQVTTIPRLSIISISKADGKWAHVNWNGYNGYCSMTYLTRVEEGVHVWDDGKITKSADYASDGVRTYSCVICGDTKDEAIPRLPLAKPEITSVSNVSGKIVVQWKKVTGATEYILFRKKNNGAWNKLTTVSTTTYTDASASKNGTCYRYKVRAVCGTNKSTKSAGRKRVYLKTPTIKKLKKKSASKLKVTYTKNKKATGYEIMYSRYTDFSHSLTQKVTSAQTGWKLLTSLRLKQKYYVRVRTYLKAEGKTSRSAWSKVKSKKM